MALTPQQLREYHERGYVVIDAPFPKKLTDDCLAAVAKHAGDPAGVAKIDGKKNHYTLMPAVADSYFCALDHSLPFLRVSLHPAIVEIARQVESDTDIYFHNGGINELSPRRSTAWHFDGGEEHVEFMHYFSGSDTKNGCLRVIPATHRPRADHLMDEVRQARRKVGRSDETWQDTADVPMPGEIPIEIGPDKLLVRSSRIFHSTHLNTTPRGRLMHHWLFTPVKEGNFRFNWKHYLTRELLAELSPEQRSLLRLEHDDPIDAKYAEEVARERGKVKWSVS